MLGYGNNAPKFVHDIYDEDRYKSQKKKTRKGISHKVLRHFPLSHHLQRLYISEHMEKYMT